MNTDNLAGITDLLRPSLRGLQQYAPPSVTRMEMSCDYTTYSIQLHVTHELFTYGELQDGSYKQNFRSRVAAAILADKRMPNGSELRRERRAFLARAARTKKSNPKPKPRKKL